MEFKDRLRESRLQKGMSQAELARRAEVTERTVQNYELGSRKPRNMEVAQKLADALDISVTYLLGSTDTHIIAAYDRGGAVAARDVESLVSEISGLFAGGTLAEEEKDAVMAALTRAYWDAKEENKKFAAKGKRGK